jgi:hypothetical protein
MRLSMLLNKHLTNAANIQESNSVNYFNLCGTIWKVRIFEGTPAIWNSCKKKRYFSVFIILVHPVYIPQYFPNMQ